MFVGEIAVGVIDGIAGRIGSGGFGACLGILLRCREMVEGY